MEMRQIMAQEPEKKQADMDARIAIMLEPQPTFPECKGTLNDSVSPLGAWVHTHIYDHGDECEVLPRPFSSELALAWRAVEHFQREGYLVSVNASAGGGFWCCMYPPVGDFIETGTTAIPAEAICRAALATAKE